MILTMIVMMKMIKLRVRKSNDAARGENGKNFVTFKCQFKRGIKI